MSEALAYVDWGRWVAQCPDCDDARLAHNPVTGDRKPSDTCATGHTFDIILPDTTAEAGIDDALAVRPEQNRRWYPAGLTFAENNGWPTGQTVQDLLDENAA